MLTSVVLASFSIWLAILLLPWRPWSVAEQLDIAASAGSDAPPPDLSDITVLIPARNESTHILTTVRAVAAQGPDIRIIVIDDESTDDTAAIVRAARIPNVTVLDGQSPPPQWTGKLWALQQGFTQVKSSCVLLLDADIEIKPGLVPALRQKFRRDQLDFLSLMAELKMDTFWERLLVPAFVFFFKLLYPFRLSNNPRFRWTAAGAGGCILVRRHTLAAIGGFAGIRGALIDDCSFASVVKKNGFRTWIGLTRSIISRRPYAELASFWNMVARTAYSQLRYSPALLMLCSVLMLLCFLVPLLALSSANILTQLLGAGILLLIGTCYVPVLDFYQRPRIWALSLPVAGLLFLGMTWTSAWRYFQGEKSSWKGRVYRTSLSG